MKVFLSWSGQPSRQVALALREWLRNMLPTIETWMSDEDISMGSRWAHQLSQQLEETSACILCLTPENMNSTWLHFEAGEIAKVVKSSLVCPFLVGVQKNELVGPLAQFQAATADRVDTLRVVRALNSAPGTPVIQQERLEKMFDVWWPQLDAELRGIDLHPRAAFDRIRPGIASIIHSSNLPMYFIDCELIVRECNEELASLLNACAATFIGQNVRLLIQKFADRVPASRRKNFLENNIALSEMVASDLGPHLEAVEYVDNRNIAGNRYDGVYRVRMHADKISAERGTSAIGAFVVYYPERLADEDAIPE